MARSWSWSAEVDVGIVTVITVTLGLLLVSWRFARAVCKVRSEGYVHQDNP